jgi:arginyl-tRNA synthetase
MIREKLVQSVKEALVKACGSGELEIREMPEITLEQPKNPAFGDFTTNIAMVLAKQANMQPRTVAEKIIGRMEADGIMERAEVAGAGFINFYLKPNWLYDIVKSIRTSGENYGRNEVGKGIKVQVEFVSANPNGPIHVAHGRGGATGDVIAGMLESQGYEVTRESYINDAPNSTQMQNFGKSVHARYMQALGYDFPMPEDGYQGEYIGDIAREIVAEHGDSFLSMPEDERIRTFTRMGEDMMLELQKEDLAKFGVKFDIWYSERSLHESGKVDAAIASLKERGYAYSKAGAMWLKSTEFGDDKDRTLVRSNGQPTYIAADAAYHKDKFERGFDKVVDVWGPDHHGYIARTKAAVAALGCDPNKLDIIIYQAVRLFSDGELVMMSKRAGDVILLSELIDEVGKDAARFFFLMRSSDSTLDFDLELAKSQSNDNPVYYVQYAHARIFSILRKAQESGYELPDAGDIDLTPLTHESEAELIKKLSEYPDVLASAAESYEPHRITRYVQDLASVFHGFYADCRVVSDEQELSLARLSLVDATRIVLANGLGILGVSAPEKM